MRLLKTVALAGVAIAAFNLSSANAAGLWVSYTGHDAFQYRWGTQDRTTSALNFNAWLSPTDDDTKNGTDLGSVFCVDLRGRVPHNPSEYEVITRSDETNWPDPSGRENFNKVSWLINNFGRSAVTRGERNGLQVAIWECAYASRFTYLGGLEADAEAAYMTYKNAAQGHRGVPTHSFRWFDADQRTGGGQDMGQPVPEPGTMLLMGAGLVGAGLISRRRRRQA